MKRILIIVISLSVLVINTFYSKELFSFLVDSSILNWFLSFLTPAFLSGLASAFLAFSLVKSLQSKKIKVLTGILIFASGIGLYLGVNKPYVEDYSKKGTELIIEKNDLLSDILSINPEFDGLIMIASKSCPYCMAAAKKLSVLQKRSNSTDVIVYIYSTSDEAIADFSLDSGVSHLDYRLVVNEESTLELCKGKFPTFLYIKDSQIIHKWYNRDLGMPALDWIESGLN